MDLHRAIETFSEAAKRVEEVGEKKLDITEPLVKDLVSSIKRTQNGLDVALNKVEGDDDNVFSRQVIKDIRNYAGHLALLCNMILNGEGYSKEETRKAIEDDVD